MNTEQVKSILIQSLSLKYVFVTGDHNHLEIVAIGDIFSGLTNVKKQQMIYYPLMKYFSNQDIHSISIQTYTIKEWKKEKQTDKIIN